MKLSSNNMMVVSQSLLFNSTAIDIENIPTYRDDSLTGSSSVQRHISRSLRSITCSITSVSLKGQLIVYSQVLIMVGDSIGTRGRRRRGRSREVVHTCQSEPLVGEHLCLIVTLASLESSVVALLLLLLLDSCCCVITEGVGVAPGGSPHGHDARVPGLARQFPQLLLAAHRVVVPGSRSLSGTGSRGSCHSTTWSHVQQHSLGGHGCCILQGLGSLPKLLLPIIRTGWETATLLNVIRMN